MPDFLIPDYDLSSLSTLRTPAVARWGFELKTREDIALLKDIYAFSLAEKLPIIFLGGGSNMLFAFDTIEAIVVKCSLKGKEKLGEHLWHIGAGESTSAFATDLYRDESISALIPWV